MPHRRDAVFMIIRAPTRRVSAHRWVSRRGRSTQVWNSPKILKAKHRSYQLQVIYTALNWWELLNYFRFEDPLYILFYTFLGAITVFEGFILWGLNRLLTKLRHPPIFHGATLFYTISEAPLKGTFYASVPYVLALSLVFHWLATPNQQYPRSEVTPPQLNSMEQTTTYVSSGTGWTPNPDNPGPPRRLVSLRFEGLRLVAIARCRGSFLR